MRLRPRSSFAITLFALAGALAGAACDARMVDPYQDDDKRAEPIDTPPATPTSPGREPVTTTTGDATQGP